MSSRDISFEEEISSGTFLPRNFSSQPGLGTEGQRGLLIQQQCCVQCCVRNATNVPYGKLTWVSFLKPLVLWYWVYYFVVLFLKF